MIKRFLRSFVYASKGIWFAIKSERNMRVHICVTLYMYFFSMFYSFTKLEYCILTILVGGVISLELLNSALERVMENPSPERYKTAGIVKDMAAGAVLVFAIISAICGCILFFQPIVLGRIFAWFASGVVRIILFLVSLIISFGFIFYFPGKEKGKKLDG